MSKALYPVGGLQFWTADELLIRDLAQARLVHAVSFALLNMNSAWRIERTEGPVLTPRDLAGSEYTDSAVFALSRPIAGGAACLRPETTKSTYAMMSAVLDAGERKLPLCMWQVGKSYRVEAKDGASPAKLRFNEFTQIEFQCAYRSDSKADYAVPVIACVEDVIGKITGRPTRAVDSDRLPAYSTKTVDVEAIHRGAWREMASISLRHDFREHVTVLEVAVGLDRLVCAATGLT